MKETLKTTLLFLLLLQSTFSLTIAQENSSGKFSGYMMADYYYNVEQHNPELNDKHGFRFRRVYFTYDYKIDNNFSTRLRLEMNNDGNYDSAESMIPFVKDAYLAYKLGNQKAYFGISSPPTFNLIEKIWGYRSVEKTPLDLQRMASSRDFGFAIKGKFDSAGKFNYHVMYGNGSANRQEIDKGKSFMASLSYWITKQIVFEVYGDYADREGKADTYITQGFIGYKSELLHGGVLYTYQKLYAKDDSKNSINLNLLSLFLSGNVAKNIKLIGRIDRMFEPNPVGERIAYTPFDNSASSTMFLTGVEYKAAAKVSIIPNIQYVKYDKNDSGITPASDLYAKLTLFWKFK
ncbi:MAG: hypothetical protein L3J41_00355 [Melioribacteraceae bacterium]|nr:hypothetical protein [Melioribacteraceae bacterium]